MRALFFIIWGVAGLVFATELLAQDQKAAAEQHFDAGKALMKVADFESAVIEFESSVNAFPTKNALFNLANCYKATHRYDQAFETYIRLKKDFEGELSPGMAVKTEEDLREILSMTARLILDVSHPGATIKINSNAVTKPSRLIDPGKHAIEISLEGYETVTLEIRVTAAETRREEIDLKPVSSTKAPPAAPMTPQPSPGTQDTATEPLGPQPPEPLDTGPKQKSDRKRFGPVPFIIAGSTTVVLAAITIIIDVQVGNKIDAAKVTVGDSLEDEAKRLQKFARMFLGLAAAGLVTTGVLFFFTDFSGKRKEPDQIALDALTPIPLDHGAGLVVQGRF
ncbi:MAG: PEGA domain-containing protein [Proteobacteria bacterium]|nr:PEGA domain-containing protein [Pseudomonadota bacterium]